MSAATTGTVIVRGFDANGKQVDMLLTVSSGALYSSTRSIAAGVQVGEKVEYASATMTIGAGSVIDTPDISDCNTFAFIISGLTTDTITLTFYLDEAKTLATAASMPINLATGVAHTTTALGVGSYKITDMVARFARFTKAAAADTPTITYLARG